MDGAVGSKPGGSSLLPAPQIPLPLAPGCYDTVATYPSGARGCTQIYAEATGHAGHKHTRDLVLLNQPEETWYTIFKAVTGQQDVEDCIHLGRAEGCAWLGISILPFGKISALIRISKHVDNAADGVNIGEEAINASRTTQTTTNSVDDVARPLSQVESRTLTDVLRPDKLSHVFDPKHNFGPLVETYGSEAGVVEQIVRSLNGAGLPSSGIFEVTTRVGGQSVVVRGAVVDGVARIGTAFTP